MKITSSAFEHNGRIPVKYSCDGENVSPPLSFADVPEQAESLVLIMDDPDIPGFVKEKMGIDVFDHWVVFNIPPSTIVVEEGGVPGKQGKNSRGEAKYTGPCPPDKEHRYFFKLYALDAELDLREGATKDEVESAMTGHVVMKAELIGLFER